MQNTKGQFLPTLFPRLLAALSVTLLIGALALAGMLGIALVGPALNHGTHTAHAAGMLVALGPGRNFTLLTATGQRLTFLCEKECRASPGHLQRHLAEHAHTDVYYIEDANHLLMALDVD